jgi:hypothetical protein
MSREPTAPQASLNSQPSREIETAVPDKPFEESFEEESSRLAESLKSCRSVVNDYRVMLTGNQALPSPDAAETSDTGQ